MRQGAELEAAMAVATKIFDDTVTAAEGGGDGGSGAFCIVCLGTNSYVR